MGSSLHITLAAAGFVAMVLHGCNGRTQTPNFDETEISNEVIVEFETLPGPRGRRIDYIIESNSIPDESRRDETAVVGEMAARLINDHYDPYYVGDLRLKVPSKSIYDDGGNRRVDVVLDQGMIIGLSDFRHHSDSASKRHPTTTSALHLLLIWNRIRVQYRVTVDLGGLKSVGDMDVRVGRLFMDVLVPDSDAPRIQMSKVTDVGSKMSGLDALPDDFRTSISAEAEFRVKTFFNSSVINVLLRYMEGVLNVSDDENMLSSFYSP